MSEMKGKYEGVDFEVTDQFLFHVETLDRDFDSYRLMTEAIDRFLASRNKVERVKISIAAVSDEGTPTNVTGIHAGHGWLLTNPNVKPQYGTAVVYLDIPIARAALEHREKLQGQVRKVQELLEQMKISPADRGYKPELYAEAVSAVEKRAEVVRAEFGDKLLESVLETMPVPNKRRF